MADISFDNLLIICVIAVLAPLSVAAVPRLRIPAVVIEIVAGIVVGPTGFGWVAIDAPVQILSLIGLAFLLFLAGLEIDLMRLRGRALAVACGGYAVTLVLGLAGGAATQSIGWTSEPLLIAVALSATSLGLVVPVLKDAGQGHSAVGQLAIASASVADFAAIVLLSFFFSTSGGSTGAKLVLLGAFAVVIGVTALAILRAGRSMRFGDLLVRLQDTTAEIRVRLAVVLLITFVALATRFGLESILGAFLAGAVVGLGRSRFELASVPADEARRDRIRLCRPGLLRQQRRSPRSDRIDALAGRSGARARVPGAAAGRAGTPALLVARTIGVRAASAVGLLQATSLPFLVTATQLGVALGKLSPVTAAAIVCAGLLSVLVFPPTALALRGAQPVPSPRDARTPRAEGGQQLIA